MIKKESQEEACNGYLIDMLKFGFQKIGFLTSKNWLRDSGY